MSSLTSKRVVSAGFWVIICVQWVFKNPIYQNKVFIFCSGFQWLKRKKNCADLLRLKASNLQRSSSNIISMLRCVTVITELQRFTSVNSTLCIVEKSWKMVKRSNEVTIIVVNFVRMIIFSFCIINAICYTLLRCFTAARITHKGITYSYNLLPQCFSCSADA